MAMPGELRIVPGLDSQIHKGPPCMRYDQYIENDSGAYSILPSWVVPKVIDDEGENDARFVKKHQALLQSLVGDDEFVARVVVDEPLTAAEREEWISCVRWRQGKLTSSTLIPLLSRHLFSPPGFRSLVP